MQKGEPLAKMVHATFPWIKIVVMIREPISRMISYTRMWTGEKKKMRSSPAELKVPVVTVE